jgi:hypothetical protein
MMSVALFKFLWFLLAILVLCIVLWFWAPGPAREAEALLIYGMVALSWPLGLFGLFVIVVTLQIAPSLQSSQSVLWAVLLPWFVWLALGYVQWFILVPILWKKLQWFRRPRNKL